MIVKIKINEDLTMMFGDSYKPWHMQFEEWLWLHKDKEIEPVNIETTAEKWIGWGGLKWCPESKIQEQFNREGCQENEPDNPNPRQYAHMRFKNNPVVTARVKKIIRNYKREISA